MQNKQVVKFLYLALAAETGLGIILLLTTGAWVSLVIILAIFGLLGGGAFLLNQLGLWDGGNWVKPEQATAPTAANNNWSSPMMGMGINLGTGPERTETVNLSFPLDDINALQVDVAHGNLRVTGQEGLAAIQLIATKRVFTRDEYMARNELDRLQVRNRREGNLLKIEAGPADGQTNLTIGRGARIDLEMIVPIAMAASLSSAAGDLIIHGYQGELSARTGAGSLIVENYNSGRNLTLSSSAGRIAIQQIAAGNVKIRTGAGTIELTGVGAESLELESAAGWIRARGINSARYVARAQLGSVDLYDARVERELQLSATAGRVQAQNITANTFQIETTTGMVFYRGTPPMHNSQVKSALGAIELFLLAGGSFNLDARSNVGSVAVNLPVTNTYSATRNVFSGVVGAGGPQLQVLTQVGSIHVAQG